MSLCKPVFDGHAQPCDVRSPLPMLLLLLLLPILLHQLLLLLLLCL